MSFSRLFVAIAENDLDAFKTALKEDTIDFSKTASYKLFRFPEPPFNESFSLPYEYTPLMAAAAKGSTNMVSLLLEAKAPLNKTSPSELATAAAFGQSKTVQLLIENKATCTPDDDVLMLTAKHGDAASIEILIDSKVIPDLNQKTRLYDEGIYSGDKSALTEAIHARSSSVVRTLLNKGADINIAKDDYGRNEIGLAQMIGDNKTIQILSDFKAAEDAITFMESKFFTENSLNGFNIKGFLAFPDRFPCDRLTITIDNNSNLTDAEKNNAKRKLENAYFAEAGFLELKQYHHRSSEKKSDPLEKSYLNWLKVHDPSAVPSDIAFEMAVNFKKNQNEFITVNNKFNIIRHVSNVDLKKELEAKSQQFFTYAAIHGNEVALDYVRVHFLKDDAKALEHLPSMAENFKDVTLDSLCKHLFQLTSKQTSSPGFFVREQQPLGILQTKLLNKQKELEKKADIPARNMYEFIHQEIMPYVNDLQRALLQLKKIDARQLPWVEFCFMANRFHEELKREVKDDDVDSMQSSPSPRKRGTP